MNARPFTPFDNVYWICCGKKGLLCQLNSIVVFAGCFCVVVVVAFGDMGTQSRVGEKEEEEEVVDMISPFIRILLLVTRESCTYLIGAETLK